MSNNIVNHAYNEDGFKVCVICHDPEDVVAERDCEDVRDYELIGVFPHRGPVVTESVTIFLCTTCAGKIYDCL